MAVPPILKKYFWEIDFKNLDPKKRAHYVIERLLDVADIEALRWMKRNYSDEEIIHVIKKSPALSLKSATFWSLYFDLPKEEIRCLNKPFRETSRAIWNH